MTTSTKEGRYIYCVIETDQPKTFGNCGIGERDDLVYSVTFKDTTAVISDSPIKRYPTSRKNLMDHEVVIETVMKDHVVLPVRFATIAEDEEEIKKILENKYDVLKETLKKMQGKKEVGVKAMFKEDEIYSSILSRYEKIKRLKQKITGKSIESSYFERVGVGKMVEAALEKEREACKNEILDTLLPLGVDHHVNDRYGELMIINSAYLIENDMEAEFEKRVEELDAKYGEKVRFKYVNQVPPFNFVNLAIHTKVVHSS